MSKNEELSKKIVSKFVVYEKITTENEDGKNVTVNTAQVDVFGGSYIVSADTKKLATELIQKAITEVLDSGTVELSKTWEKDNL